MRLALIGDHSESVVAHRAIPLALALEAEARQQVVQFDWLHTAGLQDARVLRQYDGAWLVPSSPYAGFDNVLAAIRFLRETGKPFLGTCGGYQHMMVEYARNGLGYPEAGISEIDPDCPMPLVSELICALLDVSDPVLPEPGGLIARLCGVEPLEEKYRCRFGLNPDYAGIFAGSALRVAARDRDGAVRAMALDDAAFFLGTAFQPERAALEGRRHPVVSAFVTAAGMAGSAAAAS